MTTSDTGSYVVVAQNGIYSGFRPQGYSWFLDFFHHFSESFKSIALFQFLLHALSVTIFLVVLQKALKSFSTTKFIFLSLAIMASPFSLYLTHWVMSDSVFISLTFFWMASLLHLIARGFSPWIFLFHLAIAYLAIQVRFAGLVFPLITTFTLLLVFGRSRILWSLIPLLLIFVVYRQLKSETHDLYGVETFSAFSGWARANNASIIIPHIRDEKPPIESRIRYVHSIVTQFPDSFFTKEHTINTSFMWRREFPGKAVLFSLTRNKQYESYAHAWVHSGDLLGEYGSWLMKEYPGLYFKHFFLMNTSQLFWPEVTIGPYEEKDRDEALTNWYSDDFPRMTARHDFMKSMGPFLKILNLLMWLGGIVAIGFAYKFRRDPIKRSLLFFFAGFCIAFAGFSIIAHPVHLRYILPAYPCLLALIFMATERKDKLINQ